MKILKKLRNSLNLTQKELANKLSIEQNSIAQYEGDYYPSFKTVKKISELFKISMDYLILEDNCNYPRSFNFIKLAIELENNNNPKSIKNIMITIDTSITDKDKSNVKIRQDSINEELDNNFHSNLKKLRTINNIKQNDIAEKLNIVRSVVGMYEIKSYPSVDKMIKLSRLLNCSIHALVTGEKLFFDFKDKDFGKSILIADHFLSIEDKNFLIKLMTNLIKNK